MFMELQKACSELHWYNQTGIGDGIGLFALQWNQSTTTI
jgi:hypothetical protein